MLSLPDPCLIRQSTRIFRAVAPRSLAQPLTACEPEKLHALGKLARKTLHVVLPVDLRHHRLEPGAVLFRGLSPTDTATQTAPRFFGDRRAKVACCPPVRALCAGRDPSSPRLDMAPSSPPVDAEALGELAGRCASRPRLDADAVAEMTGRGASRPGFDAEALGEMAGMMRG